MPTQVNGYKCDECGKVFKTSAEAWECEREDLFAKQAKEVDYLYAQLDNAFSKTKLSYPRLIALLKYCIAELQGKKKRQ